MASISSARLSTPSPVSGATGRMPVNSSVSVEADMATISSTQMNVYQGNGALGHKGLLAWALGTGKAAHRTAGAAGGDTGRMGDAATAKTRAYCPFLPMGFTPASLRRRKGWTARIPCDDGGSAAAVPVRGRLFGVIRHSLGAPDGQAVAAMGIWASASGGAGNLPIRAGERRVFPRAEGCRWGAFACPAWRQGRGLCGVPVRGAPFRRHPAQPRCA